MSSTDDFSIYHSPPDIEPGRAEFWWKIKDFRTRYFLYGEGIRFSPCFLSRRHGMAVATLMLYPNGCDVKESNHLSLIFTVDKMFGSVRSVKFKIYFLQNSSEKFLCASGKMDLDKQDCQCKIPMFMSRNVLFEPQRQLFQQNNLTIVCELFEDVCDENASLLATSGEGSARVRQNMTCTMTRECQEKTQNHREEDKSRKKTNLGKKTNPEMKIKFKKEYKSKNEDKSTETDFEEAVALVTNDNLSNRLFQDMASVFEEAKFSDVTLRAAGGEAIRAHKAILSARSPVFSSIFEREMQELDTDVLELADVAHDVLKQFVSYLYCGKMGELTVQSSMGLLAASDKFDVQGIRDVCVRFLKDHLSLENCLDIAVFADDNSMDELRRAALEFACSHFETMSASSGWKDRLKERPHLAVELLFAMNTKAK